VEKAMEILQKHYPDEDHVFIFDNATTHLKRPEGALSALKMTKGPSANFTVEVNDLDNNGKLQYAPNGKTLKKKYPLEMVDSQMVKSRPFITQMTPLIPMLANSRGWQ